MYALQFHALSSSLVAKLLKQAPCQNSDSRVVAVVASKDAESSIHFSFHFSLDPTRPRLSFASSNRGGFNVNVAKVGIANSHL